MNIFEKAIAFVSPGWALSRKKNSNILNAYEVSKTPNRLRKQRGDNFSGDYSASTALPNMRKLARDLDQNNDLARGILNTLVNNTVGTGISVEPTVKLLDGTMDEETNDRLIELHEEWKKKPEVTKELCWGETERLAARSLFRDGELFAQHVIGNKNNFNHDTIVPYSVELIESDMVPTTFTNEAKNIINGIQRNSWGQALFFYVLKKHPGDYGAFSSLVSSSDYKRISAKKMLHVKLIDRIRQGRGMSVFASVFTRLDDLRDFEESERVAARIAAAQVLAITKSADTDSFLDNDSNEPRSFDVSPGSVWDNLLPGEELKIVSSDRPNNNLESFRNGQMKATAAGTGTTFSAISKTYDGNFGAQRQELVESYVNYDVLTKLIVSKFSMPSWEMFVDSARNAGLIEFSDNTDQTTLFSADYRTKGMPWIDPDKESKAQERLVKNRFVAPSQVIRSRGDNPMTVFKQIAKDKKIMDELGITPEELFNQQEMNLTIEQN